MPRVCKNSSNRSIGVSETSTSPNEKSSRAICDTREPDYQLVESEPGLRVHLESQERIIIICVQLPINRDGGMTPSSIQFLSHGHVRDGDLDKRFSDRFVTQANVEGYGHLSRVQHHLAIPKFRGKYF